jgi:hypothetical protein
VHRPVRPARPAFGPSGVASSLAGGGWGAPPRLSRRSALACLLGAWGCATPTVRLGGGPREYVAEDYDSVLRRWTRTESLLSLSALDNFLTATATYESWDFRWAYVVRYAEDYRLTVDQRHALLERSLAETGLHHQFYLALYAQHPRWADLTARDPAWIVRLIDDQGGETAPSEIELIRRPGPIELTYYPYTTPWRTIHRVRFPVLTLDGRRTISPKARWLGLRFAGPQGNHRLLWTLAG